MLLLFYTGGSDFINFGSWPQVLRRSYLNLKSCEKGMDFYSKKDHNIESIPL